MSKTQNIVQDVDIALDGIAKFSQRVLRKLKPAEKKKVLEAFEELSQYAATVQDEAEQIALSEVLYRIIDETPVLRGFLPKKEVKPAKTKDVPLDLFEQVDDEREKAQFVTKHETGIINNLLVIVESQGSSSSPSPPPTTRTERANWLSRIYQRFSGNKDK